MIQEHKLLVVTNIEKRPEWSDLLFLELPKTTKEEEDHFILIQKQIADLEKKNDEMEKTIQKQRMNVRLKLGFLNLNLFLFFYFYFIA